MRGTIAAALLAALHPAAAAAHTGRAVAPHDLWTAWAAEPAAVAALLAAAWLYARGVERLWARAGAGAGRGIRRGEAAAFAGGWGLLALALVSPLHAAGEALFSAHMAQHALLVAGAAPLLVAGRPLAAIAWGLPRRWRGAAGRAARGTALPPLPAFALHAAVVWGWHLPALYDASLRSPAVHALQHAAFLGTALVFWQALLHRPASAFGGGIAALFATALHSGVLGALIAFAPTAWYAGYAGTTAPWGMTPVEDQQLAGLVMWMPAGLAYLGAALWMLVRWLRASERRAGRWAVAAAMAGAMAVAGCRSPENDLTREQAVVLTRGGVPERGAAAIRAYGCDACHTIPGIPGARALIGPPLGGLGARAYVAGRLPNTPENLAAWIADPQAVDSLTAMPDVGVTPSDARDIAAYLYTLR